MRITSWNFLHGQSLTPGEKGDYSASLSQLGCDVLALQEIDMNLERSGSTNQTAEIAQVLKTTHWGFAPTVHGTPGFSWRKVSAENLRVHTAADENLADHYGIAIVSTVPVRQWLRLDLGKAWIGLPLLVANEKGKVAPFYVKDEPRVALAAVLENGWTVINVHLSFVPLVNIFQLLKVSRWAKKLAKEHSTKVALVGDFNLPWGLPTRVTRWVRATDALSYPSWKPAISFDYILLREADAIKASEVSAPPMSISDHRPISIDI
jgi:endonuclease/exonuclease/phosphatase family metal-dependent hydrolase